VRYLLDTNIVSDLVRNPQGSAARQLEVVGDANVCTSIVVAAELRYGAIKKASPRHFEGRRAISLKESTCNTCHT
jgi:tRNA(fMet)-specific endonuclease VapC